MSTKASIAIQDLTYTEKQLGLGVTISYTNGGTAGSEVVSVSGHAITVQIASGTSTATQIKTAIEANYEANLLVAITVTGTGSAAQKTCKLATLSGGSAAVAATKQIGPLLYTAVTAGTGGNSIRIKYQNGGSISVGVASNDITVTLVNGASTANAVAAAVNANGSAAALVAVTRVGFDDPILVSHASSFTALTGGAAAAAASVVVQDLTFSGDATGTSKNGSTVSYTAGATAGAEVVSVSGANVTVQIENGVSTATQIKTAFDASEAANGAKAHGHVTVADYANGNLTAASGSIVVNAYAPLHLTKASGTITYGSPDVLTKATGTVTVANYASHNSAKSSGTITVVDYTKLAEATATASGDITYGTPADASTVVVTGPAGGPYTFTKVTSDPEANQFSSADELAYLINQIAGLDAANVAGTISLTVETAGTGPNAWTISGTSSFSGLAITFSGGQNHATCTVNGTVLTEGTDWNAATDNDTTAASLELAIEAVTGVDSSATAAAITVEAATAGVAGDAITLATSDAVNLTKSGATLSGGRDATVVTVAGHALTAGVDYTAATGNNETAESLKDAITALTEVNATRADAVVTVEAASGGTAGNDITLVTSASANATVSGPKLAGGLAASTVTVNGTAFTCVASSPSAAEFSSIAELTALVAAVTGVDATDNGTVVAVEAATAGTAGNSITLTKTGSGLTLSGALLAGGIDAATVTVAGHVLTESADWTASTDTATTAESLKDAIHALAEVNCTRTDSTCNIVAATAGTAGNDITLAVSDGTNLTKSGAKLTGGIPALVITVNGTAVTEGTDFNAVTDNATTAHNLATAIDGLAGFTATHADAVVTIVSDTFGTGGNSQTLTTNLPAVASVSGATLTGGVAAWNCTVSGTGSNTQKTVNATATSGEVGDGPDAYAANQAGTALTSSFVAFAWNFPSSVVTIRNDEPSGSNQVLVSLDGTNTHYTLNATESLVINGADRRLYGVWLKYGTGAPDYRLMVL